MLPAGRNYLSHTSLIGETSTKARIRIILVCEVAKNGILGATCSDSHSQSSPKRIDLARKNNALEKPIKKEGIFHEYPKKESAHFPSFSRSKPGLWPREWCDYIKERSQPEASQTRSFHEHEIRIPPNPVRVK
jgi:hypothetical protein